ncbi:MAG: HlyC/CorC family transporter [Desulfobulbaceae bacterium]|uniref:HlyC/CorC family transporter n=1 Tax=Candidatus Desulfatifera sulfidica TaxID=2841691 RepID=A0A8J6N810_9BACT|nr:HlyC/CorC family transporter [Candidatus Desulfatifera sulfidica]
MKAEPPAESEGKSFLKRMVDVLFFWRGPDTKESLENEIQELLEEGEEQGFITPLEERMISSIFEFRETVVGEVMTPAAEIVSAEESTPVKELVRLISDKGHTRIPIYRIQTDDVIGILHAKDLLQVCALDGEDLSVSDCLKSVYVVDESKFIVDLLREFQVRKIHMALVTDEFGAVRGLVTLEDVLEEIVGEIDDEYDNDRSEIKIIDPQTIMVQARIDVDEVEDHFQVELPEGPYESVGGLVIHALGRLAVAGDEVAVGELNFLVRGASKRRIKTIRVSRTPADGAQE